MQSLKWFIAGSIGGAIGAAIWVAVGYYSSCEVGWIAWGIGFLVGISVRMAAGKVDGPSPGVIAGATAIIAVLTAKFLVASFLVSDALDEIPNLTQVTPDHMVACHAAEIAEEQEAAGKKLNWPAQPDFPEAPPEQYFPKEIWTEAQKRWQSLSPEEQAEEQAEETAQYKAHLENAVEQYKKEAFTGSFSPWDLLWFGLAAFTAFKIGSGLTNDE